MSILQISLPEYVETALDLLANAGYESYAVGGCVRDAVLQKKPNDWDITTAATPNEIKQVFCSYKTIETGLQHGTLSVIINEKLIEITTMRIDGNYTDNRHPDSVEFTQNIFEDLSRRDFTINAMAFNKSRGLIDPFNGRGDVSKKIIKCVGDANKRFHEDSLRIMRGLRFSSVLGFEIEDETKIAILKNYSLLNNVAKERIRDELIKLLCGKDVCNILFTFAPVFFEIIPQLSPLYGFAQNTPYHVYDIWRHTVLSVGAIQAKPILRMTMLLHDIGKPEKHTVDENKIDHFKNHQEQSYLKAREILKNLRFSKAQQEEICKLIKYHDIRPTGEEKETLKLAKELTPTFLKQLLPVLRADAMARNPLYLPKKLEELDLVEKTLENAIKNKQCFSISELAVDGSDLIKLGFKGKEIGEGLELILDKIIDGELENNRPSLLDFLKNTARRLK